MDWKSRKEEIINEILLNSDVVVKSQQIGEPEMTLEEKRRFLGDYIEQKKASAFLSRFGRFLKSAQLRYFESRHNDDEDEKYCINFHIQQLEKNLAPRAATVRNRRFGALQKLLQDKNDHFSEQEMMRREPVLYEQLVGQYMTEQEKQMRDRSENPTFLSALLKGIEMEHLRESTTTAANVDQEDDDSDREEEDVPRQSSSLWGEFDDAPQERAKPKRAPTKNVSDGERDELRKEFIETMYEKFMSGSDEFNYEAVDNNAEYDDLEMVDQDEQDKYFDESDDLSALSDGPAEQAAVMVDK